MTATGLYSPTARPESDARGSVAAVAAARRLPWLWRLFRPRRTIRPTRDGWWCLFAAVGLGIAAVNTGNNLLYLLSSMLLGLIVVSGILSEAVMRGIRLAPILPDEMYAGRPALVGAVVANEKRRVTSYSLTIDVLPRGGPADRVIALPRVPAGQERTVTWEATMPRRGRHRLGGVRLSTRFPFGIFVKAGRAALDEEVLVFPAVGPPPDHLLRQVGGAGAAPSRRRGRGSDLYNLRDYVAGDDPRLIHWRSSAKTAVLTVRELEAETALDTRIVLDGAGDAALLERGLSDAASVAAHLVRGGARVEVVGPGIAVPLGHGRAHLRRILGALALYAPAVAPGEGPDRPAAGLREIRIRIGR